MRGLNAPDRNETLTAALQGVELIAFLSDSTGAHQILSPVTFIEMMGLDTASFARMRPYTEARPFATAAQSIQSHLRVSLQVLAVVATASEGDLHNAIFRYRRSRSPRWTTVCPRSPTPGYRLRRGGLDDRCSAFRAFGFDMGSHLAWPQGQQEVSELEIQPQDLLDLATQVLFGSATQGWLNKPHRLLNGRTPAAFAAEDGSEMVRSMLIAIQHGGVA